MHRMGRRITLYVEGLIVPEESELFEHLPAVRDWVVINSDGPTNGNYTRQGLLHMCPGSGEWQDHLAAMCARLMRESGIDGIHIDSLGYYFWPCHNPKHHHASPFDYNLRVQGPYAKVARAVRGVKPDALLSTEAPADFRFPYLNHALHSMNDLEIPYSVSEGTSPLRVALPEYRLHSTATVAAPVLQIQSIWQYVGAEDAPWVAAYPAVAPVFCDGDASLPDPITDQPDMASRRGRGSSTSRGASSPSSRGRRRELHRGDQLVRGAVPPGGRTGALLDRAPGAGGRGREDRRLHTCARPDRAVEAKFRVPGLTGLEEIRIRVPGERDEPTAR